MLTLALAYLTVALLVGILFGHACLSETQQ
jgi:hypothetical protein